MCVFLCLLRPDVSSLDHPLSVAASPVQHLDANVLDKLNSARLLFAPKICRNTPLLTLNYQHKSLCCFHACATMRVRLCLLSEVKDESFVWVPFIKPS